jgi:ribosomal protein S18 acetylase RimI-like enzyme
VDLCCLSSIFPCSSAASQEKLDASSIIIRSAELRDAKALAEVLARGFHPSGGLFHWLYPVLKLGIYEDVRSRFRANAPYYRCLVASKVSIKGTQAVEEIIGTVEIALRSRSFSEGGSPYISNLVVSYSYRRQGIARKLLLKCEQIALEWRCQRISLHVLENNYPARQLYLASGYKIDRVEPSLSRWLLQHPRKLLLHKCMN